VAALGYHYKFSCEQIKQLTIAQVRNYMEQLAIFLGASPDTSSED